MIKNNRRRKRVIIIVLLPFLSFLLIIPNSIANPIPVGPDLSYSGILFLIFFVNLIVEYFVISIFLANYRPYRLKMFKPVFTVNLFTFPITQFIALLIFLSYPFAIGLHFTAEFFPLMVETILYLKINEIKYRNGEIKFPIPIKRTICYTITANLITFSLGFLVFMQYTNFYYA